MSDLDFLKMSEGARKIIERFNLTSLEKLLNIDYTLYRQIVDSSKQRRYYFDELFILLKKNGLSYSFMPKYYYNLVKRSNDLGSILINDLELSIRMRKYLSEYKNLQEFFIDITYNKSKLNRFLYFNIRDEEDYSYFLDLLDSLGNNGVILKGIIKEYQNYQKEGNSLYTPLYKIFKKSKTLEILNTYDIYLVGDFLSMPFSTLEEIIPAKKIAIFKATLDENGYSLENENYVPLRFSFDCLDIKSLCLDKYLEDELEILGVKNVHEVLFSPKMREVNKEDLKIIREHFSYLNFNLDEPFLYDSYDKNVLRYQNLLFEEKGLKMRDREIDSYLGGIKPLLKEESQELTKINDIPFSEDIKEYLKGYGSLEEFVSKMYQDKRELDRFLALNIKSNWDYKEFFKTLETLGNDGVLLKLIIREFLNIQKKKEISLYTPLDKIIGKNKTLETLNKHNIYFLVDLLELSEEKLLNDGDFSIRKINAIMRIAREYNYLGEENNQGLRFSLQTLGISLLNLPIKIVKKLNSLEIYNLQDILTSSMVNYFSLEELVIIRNSLNNLGFNLQEPFNYNKEINEAIKYNNLLFEKKALVEREKKIRASLEEVSSLLALKPQDVLQLGTVRTSNFK
mgnify:FL=1